MKHGFLISAYKNGKTISEQINLLDSSDSYFYIHIDKKSPLFEDEAIQNLKTKENVIFLADRIKVYWGGFSHLQAIIYLIREALKNKELHYLHLMSDSCCPIKSRNEIFDFFENNSGKEFIEFIQLPSPNWAGGGLNRITQYHLHDFINLKSKLKRRIEKYFVKLQQLVGIKRTLPTNFTTFYGGCTWWTLSRNFLDYAINYIDNNPGFYKRFKHSFCAEEILIHTLLLNSPFRENVVNDNLRYIDWENRNGNRPANLDETDLPILLNSEKLFARKFVYPLSNSLLDNIKVKMHP